MSDRDGYSYVLVNGIKTKDTSVSQNDSSMYDTKALNITATIQPTGEAVARAARPEELKDIAGNYSIKLVGTNHTKVSTSGGSAAIGTDIYRKFTEGEASTYNTAHAGDPGHVDVSAGDDYLPLELTAGNTVYALFTINSSGEFSVTSVSVSAAVQGDVSEEDADTFTTNEPTVTATLGTGSAANGSDWAPVATN